MTVDPRKLLVLVEGRENTPSAGPVPLPTPGDVLYAKPNRDGTRKKCSNCGLYAERDARCLLFGKDKEVTPTMVCGYHCNGEPQLFATTLSHTGAAIADPALSGLIEGPDGGTSCDRCAYYDARDKRGGICHAVATEDGKPARVEAMGCCARWQANSESVR